jgi:flagellar motor switch protein FliM
MSESADISNSATPVTVDGLNGVVFSYEGHRKDIDPSKILAYNFRQPGFLSQRDMGQLGLIHRNFLQGLSNRLGTFLRMEVAHDKKSLRCSNQPFREFCDSIEPPTHLTLFQIAPLDGVGILELRPGMSLALANRLLGGRGMVSDLERNPTEIEIALLDEIILILLKEWVGCFEDGPMGTPAVVGHEANTRFLQISADDSPFFVMRGELTFGELTEAIQLAVPFAMIDALTNRLSTLSKGPAKSAEPRRKPLQWRAPYAGIQVELRAEWEVRSIPISEALGYGPGQLVELPQELIDQTKVYVSDREEFYGTIGVEDGRLAVHLNERISKE